MAHARAPQTNAVRRRRPHRRGPRARLDRRPRPALTGGAAQARQQTRCRWPPGAQLPKPVARPRHLHTQRDDHHPERGLQLYLGSHPDPDPRPSLRPARRRSNQAVASKRHSRRELSKQDQSYASRRSKNFRLAYALSLYVLVLAPAYWFLGAKFIGSVALTGGIICGAGALIGATLTIHKDKSS